MRGAGYSGRAADMWACGASLFMWLYHRSPYTADNQIDLLNAIANDEVEYPPDDLHSEELLTLLRGLLERKPKMRLRTRDVRRNSFITENGTNPLPAAIAAPVLTVAKVELNQCVQRAVLMKRAGLAVDAGSADHTVPPGAVLSDAVPLGASAPLDAVQPETASGAGEGVNAPVQAT